MSPRGSNPMVAPRVGAASSVQPAVPVKIYSTSLGQKGAVKVGQFAVCYSTASCASRGIEEEIVRRLRLWVGGSNGAGCGESNALLVLPRCSFLPAAPLCAITILYEMLLIDPS